MVQIQEIELTVGDVFQVGDTTVTVIDIDNGEVTFRIDDGASHDGDPTNGRVDTASPPLPR